MSLNRKPKVCHIASGDLWAGAEVQVYNIVAGLKELREFDVIAIIMNRGRLYESLSQAGIGVFLVEETRLNLLQQIQSMRSIISRQHVDIVHSHRYKENILSCTSGLSLNQVPRLIKTQHSSIKNPSTFYLRTYHTLDLILTRLFFSRVITVSYDISKEFSKFLPKNKIKVIPNSIDPKYYKCQPKSSPIKRPFRLGLAGRLVPVKNVSEFIEIAVELKKTDAIRAAFIAGDGPLLPSLKELVRKNAANSYIRFLGHVDNIVDFFTKIDLLVITSHHEGIPTVLLEAMYLGKPVIARRTGGIPEVIMNYYNGFLYSRRWEAEKIVKELLMDVSLLKRIVKAARQTVIDRFINVKQASGYASIYASLIEQ